MSEKLENGNGSLILIVEDSPVQAERLKHTLTQEGYRTAVAQNGAEGLALTQTLKPALILSNIVMPVMDGYQMCMEIKNTEALKNIPVVMLTQLYEPEEIIRGLESGADALMTKSIGDNQFIQKLRSLLSNSLQFRNHTDLKCISFEYDDKSYEIHSGRAQTLSLLISSYESAIWSNREQIKAQEQLRDLNELLEITLNNLKRELNDEIAEHERTEQELRESEQRFRTIFESNSDGLITLCLKDKKFSLCNQTICRMLGYDKNELLRLGVEDIHPASELPHVFRQLERQILREISVAENIPVKRKDGSVFIADINTSPITLDGQPCMIGAFRDVTERKRLQSSEIARIAAENANHAKSEFLANMSHELRTPLNSVIGFSEILQDELYGPINEKQREYIRNILTSGRHLLSLINDILDLSKVESGKMELELSLFPLRELLDSSLMMFREKAMKHGIHLHLELEPQADVRLRADQRKLKQVMFNLLSNAIKFTQSGKTVLVSARLLPERETPQGFPGNERADSSQHKGDQIEISIADSGKGIREEDIPKLFQPFTQLEPSNTKEHEGAGLGLALTRQLVELHGGTIRVESVFGSGSTFTVTIPLQI